MSIAPTFANQITPIIDIVTLAGLLTVLWFCAAALYSELRYGINFTTFRRQNAHLLPPVFGACVAVVLMGFAYMGWV